MKQLITLLTIVFISSGLQAQDKSKFESAMLSTFKKMAEAKTAEDYQAVANTFGRIATNEKEEWTPIYYSAFIKTFRSYEESDKAAAAASIAEVQDAVTATLALENVKNDAKAQSEIHTLLGMMYGARMMENPMALGAKYMPMQAQELAKAEAADANNPRLWLLRAQNLFYTPEAFGGDKVKAKELLEKAMELFNAEEKLAEPTLWPRWGKEQAMGLQAQLSK